MTGVEGYITMKATCRTRDGRTVGMISPVAPELFEDTKALLGFARYTLRDAAADGDPPGELLYETLRVERLDR